MICANTFRPCIKNMAQGESGVISGSVAPRVCLQNRAQCPAKESGLTQLGWVILTVRNDINGPLQHLSVVGERATECISFPF